MHREKPQEVAKFREWLRVDNEFLRLKKDTLRIFLALEKGSDNSQNYRDAVRELVEIEHSILSNQEILALLS